MPIGVIGRVIGILVRPRPAFEGVVAAPKWGALLAALFAVNVAVNAAFASTGVGRQALVDQWERTALAFGQEVDDARYAEFQELSRQGAAYAVVVQLVRGPVAAFALAALLYAAFRTRGASGATYRQVLALVVSASVVLTLREIVAAPINYVRESIASPTTLAQIFPVTNAASPLARFFGLVDLFVLWWLGLLAVGLGVLYRRRSWTIAAVLFGVYGGIALALAAAMAILGGTI